MIMLYVKLILNTCQNLSWKGLLSNSHRLLWLHSVEAQKRALSVRGSMCDDDEVKQLVLGDDTFIEYKQTKSLNGGNGGIMLCAGLLSTMDGNKAKFLREYCLQRDLSFTRFNYMGHGHSSGRFEDFTVSLLKQNTIDVLDQLTKGPQVLIGSSIGGWIALLVALARPERILHLVTIACAADFMAKRLRLLTEEERSEISHQGFYPLASPYSNEPYKIPLTCFEDADMNCLLKEDNLVIDIRCPVRLLHGTSDEVIPFANSIDVALKLMSDDVKVILQKGSDHRMSDTKSLDELSRILDELLPLKGKL